MKNEEINRRISELRGPQVGYQFPHNWIGDEAANAELLEEMAKPGIEAQLYWEAGTWFMWILPWDCGNDVQHTDRKTAIALAWLKWKESTPGEKNDE